MRDYKNRVFDAILRDKLSYMGAVLVQGPKWCGKTTTCEQIAKSVFYMADPKMAETSLEIARLNPDSILTGAEPRLIDEWQMAPCLWDAVRFSVDHGKGRGRFILTGSAVPPEADESSPAGVRKISHTGTGRIARINMRTMSLFESGESTGGVSLAALFGGDDPTGAHSKLSLEEVALLICRGGWPEAIDLSPRVARGPAREYYKAVVESDVSRVDSTIRNPDRVKRLMRSLARLQGTQASAAVIREDMVSNDAAELTETTVYSYLTALGRIFVTEDMPAWCPNLRCKTPVRTADTRYFTDPSIATAALGVGPGDLMNDLTALGLYFETLAVRDLRCYADVLEGGVYHYLDKSGLECDAVVHLEDGRYGLVEIKLGGERLIAKGVDTLTKLSGKIDTHKMPPPSFRMVLTAVGDFAYRRKEDGILICPIGCLKP